jgi:predicted phage tail protein
MLRNVYLEGELGDTFIPHFKAVVDTPVDIIRFLNANFGDTKKYFLQKEEEQIAYHIEVAGQNLEDSRELLMTIGEGDIIITPIPAGSKGVGKLIAAVALAVLAYKLPFLAPSIKSALYGVAANLAIVGIQEMMLPDPATDDAEGQDESYLFDGAETIITQGDPVPVLYGRLRVPGQPIHFELKGGGVRYQYDEVGLNNAAVQGAAAVGPVDQIEDGESQHIDTPFPPLNTDATEFIGSIGAGRQSDNTGTQML